MRPLENTLIKLLRSLDFHDEIGHTKIAIGEILLKSKHDASAYSLDWRLAFCLDEQQMDFVLDFGRGIQ